MTIFEASQRYLAEGTPTIVIAGKEYGSGSSRDWAAKGPNLLGVKAVIAESYERIHRSNLLMMGILPLQFRDGETPDTLGLTGREAFAIEGIENGEASEVTVRADDDDLHRARAPGHAARARVPAPRRHPPVRAPPPARRLKSLLFSTDIAATAGRLLAPTGSSAPGLGRGTIRGAPAWRPGSFVRVAANRGARPTGLRTHPLT